MAVTQITAAVKACGLAFLEDVISGKNRLPARTQRAFCPVDFAIDGVRLQTRHR
jgi:hypothetical protein